MHSQLNSLFLLSKFDSQSAVSSSHSCSFRSSPLGFIKIHSLLISRISFLGLLILANASSFLNKVAVWTSLHTRSPFQWLLHPSTSTDTGYLLNFPPFPYPFYWPLRCSYAFVAARAKTCIFCLFMYIPIWSC